MTAKGRAAVAASTLLLVSGLARASGFNIYEAGTRATALGGAFTATADDASAIFYNPAGLSFLTGDRLDLCVTPILPNSRFTGAAPPEPVPTGRTEKEGFVIPGAYYAHNGGGALAFGVGLSAPFGLGVHWQDERDWVGRQNSHDVTLATVYVTPAVAARISDRAALSLGLDVAWSSVELNRITATAYGGRSELVNVIAQQLKGDSGLNLTPCLGLLVHARDDLSLGFMYRAPKAMVFTNQDATLTNITPEELSDLHAAVDAQIAGLGGTRHKVDTKVRLPAFASFGVAYRFHSRAQLEFDAVYFEWSNFDALVLSFDNPALDQTIREAYEDIWQLRFGLDLDLTPEVKAMFGYVHDNTPQPTPSISPLLPDADREDISLGLQWRRERWQLTGSYMAVLFHERSNIDNGRIVRFADTQPAGAYDSVANIISVGVGYGF